VKEVIDLLEEVDVMLLEVVIMYYTIQNFPKEYEVFKHMLFNTRQLPPYKELESMLINKELSFKMNTHDDAEVILVQHCKF
jgi:hypothetical protein